MTTAGSPAQPAATNPGPEVNSPNGVASTPPRGVVPGRSVRAGWGLPLIVLVIGMFMSVLDSSIVNVAIPTIQNEFGGTTDDVQWVVTGYTLMLGVIVPITAWLGDRVGLKQLYNLALVAFAAGSALCGLAWDLNSLVIFRILQAMPGGILPVITLSILLRIVPREQLGTAMGLYGLGIVFAPGVGPVLGGYLVEYVNWRLIFYINVPIGIVGAVAATLVLPRFPRVARGRFDVLGFLSVGGGLFALLLATSEGESWGWGSYRVLGLLTYGVLSLALFAVIELEVTDPLLDIRILRYGPFVNSLLLIAVLMIAMYGVLFYIPQFLQQAQGWGAFNAGLTLLPQALTMAVLMPVAGRVYDRIGPRWPAAIGLATVAAGTYLLHTLTIDTPREHVMWLLVVLGIGLGIAFMPILTGGVAVIPLARASAASAINNVVQRVSGALGLAILTAILTVQRAQQLAGRAALVPENTPVPHLGPSGTPPAGPLGAPPAGPLGTPPDWLNVWGVYHQSSLQVFVGAIDDLFLISAGLATLGALGALALRSGPATAPPPPAAAPSADGEVTVEAHPLPPATAPDNGASAAPTNGLLNVRTDAHSQGT
ncbi:MAG: DHA2 family efflux MFS transporter permease subunit [Pseudonocardiales bacterium]|nr:DHA2 family efflux MFS transporter permease subunit [Pseudonocardiales bacterium]